MQVDVNGTRLWFDVDGPLLEPAGTMMRNRPTVVLIHGGPGSYDHSYFKPDFAPLARRAQVIYLDLRDHGRSARHDPADWSFELCADDVRAFCDALGIVRPVVFGHSMGGIVAMLYGARHPGHAAGLVLQSTFARFDLGRLVSGVRRVAGDEVARLAERDYGGDPVSDAEWARVFAAFGPVVPDADQLGRRIGEPGCRRARHGPAPCARHRRPARSRRQPDAGLRRCARPDHAGRGVARDRRGLPHGLGRLAIIKGAGHFPWKDAPERYWPLLERFIAS